MCSNLSILYMRKLTEAQSQQGTAYQLVTEHSLEPKSLVFRVTALPALSASFPKPYSPLPLSPLSDPLLPPYLESYVEMLLYRHPLSPQDTPEVVASVLQADSLHSSSPGHCSHHFCFLPCPQTVVTGPLRTPASHQHPPCPHLLIRPCWQPSGSKL